MTFPIARSIHLELSRERLNASLTGGIPSLSYAGPVDKMTFKELANLLCSMDAASWPGSTGDDNQGKRRKDQCEWDLCILVKEPAQQRIRVYGADKGRSTPRLEAEAKLCAYLKKKLAKLHSSMPRQLERLTLSDRVTGGYWSVTDDEGRVRVCVIANGRPETEFYVDPELLQELCALMDKSAADSWHGFGYGNYEAGKMPLYFEAAYNTTQTVLVMADPNNMPKNFAPFCDALRERLGLLAQRWQKTGTVPTGGIKRFNFMENGMRIMPHYVAYRRLDAEGARLHLTRILLNSPDGDVTLNEAEELELADILRGLASWDGFNGTARNVLDAPGFSFNVELADGKKIKASGYGMTPAGYREGKDRLLNFIEKRLPTRGLPRHEGRGM